jgi:hypothetical protein
MARMLGFTLAVLLAIAPDPAAARAELDACARRIEELKARHLAGQPVGRELVRLLVRSQELVAQLERARVELPPAPPAPSPEELRERADAARDDADRLAAEIADLDVRIGDGRQALRAEAEGPIARAGLGGGHARAVEHAAAAERLRELQARRAMLATRRAHAEAAAASLEGEANAAEAAR